MLESEDRPSRNASQAQEEVKSDKSKYEEIRNKWEMYRFDADEQQV